MSALILDGELKSALSAIRSLGKRGITVVSGSLRESAMGLHSKCTNESFVYPSPYVDQEGFVASVREAARRIGDTPVVFAFSDATWLSLYAHREVLKEDMTLVFPNDDAVAIAFDKAATYSLARVSGVPTITSHTAELPSEVPYLADTLTFPLVVKPRRSVVWREGRGVFGSASFVHDKGELVRKFSELKDAWGEAPLIQDLLVGEEYGVEMIASEGKPLAIVTHHRLRSLSPTGGASVLKETLGQGILRETLEAHALTLIQKISWSGPIMVEFKVNSDTREPKLMEINGRFWGSLPLSIAAGVDMPYIYYALAEGTHSDTEVIRGKDGVTTRHFLGDVMHLTRVLCTRDKLRHLLYPERSKAIRDFCILPKGTKSDVWSLQDPKPAIMEFIDAVKKRT